MSDKITCKLLPWLFPCVVWAFITMIVDRLPNFCLLRWRVDLKYQNFFFDSKMIWSQKQFFVTSMKMKQGLTFLLRILLVYKRIARKNWKNVVKTQWYTTLKLKETVCYLIKHILSQSWFDQKIAILWASRKWSS